MKSYHLGQMYHLELILSSGENVFMWDTILASGANVILREVMLSSGMNRYRFIIWSSCYHLEQMLSRGMII
jgi:hypothetical protein